MIAVNISPHLSPHLLYYAGTRPVELDRWFSLFGICLLGAMSPGPSLAVVLNAALGEGRRAG